MEYSSTFGPDYYSFWCSGVKGIVVNTALFFGQWTELTMIERQADQNGTVCVCVESSDG